MRFRPASIPALILFTAVLATAADGVPKETQQILDKQYHQLDAYLTAKLDEAPGKRAAYWKLDFSSLANYQRSLQPYRKDWAEMLGVPPSYKGPLKEKRVRIGETPKYTMYRVWFDAMPALETYGILIIPKGIQGRMPALICQHGAAGMPEATVGLVNQPIYREFARVFAEKGFVTFRPYLIWRYSESNQPADGPDAWGRDILFKKAMLVGTTLEGVEMSKFTRTVDYLQSLPEVDGNRIGMYGLSEGRQYALAFAPLDTRIKVVVCSGWFNDRAKKNLETAPNPSMHFLTLTHRSEFYPRNLLEQFGDAELGWMIAPRPFLVENGDLDTAVHIDDARAEFERVKKVYYRLGLNDRAIFAGFHGDHRIDGAESFPFVEKWLR